MKTRNNVDREAIVGYLLAYNDFVEPGSCLWPFAFLIKDDDGNTIGGLWGRTAYRWAFVELLFIPDNLRGRGLGKQLMVAAENLAVERGAIGIWLDSYSFQAPGFYRRLGYEVFGELNDNPPGQTRYFLRKGLSSVQV